MYSFIICIAALVLGYVIYGRFVERIFMPKPLTELPALSKADGVDYVPMPAWKVFMIQFLNIAGTGPIFGAIMGAKFGPSCYLWIVLGSIFAGAVHDFACGVMSMRHGGSNLPDIASIYLGKNAKNAMLVFSLVLLILVGVVFVYSPALLLGDLAKLSTVPSNSVMIWVGIIFAYYLLATVLPVDKIIGRIYPLFAFAMLFMAVALCVCLFAKWPSIPEFWDGLANRGPSLGIKGQQIFPCLFITVACGALSGFHSTQSPLMARCITDSRHARPIFYGAMITEGIVALIWAAVSSYFFFDGGKEALGAVSGSAPVVVSSVAKSWLGTFGGILAILGVVIAPISSGDTAFRSARLIIADFVGLKQKAYRNRFIIAIPMFGAAALLLWYNVADENGFNVIWRYFGLANQALAAFSLVAATDYLTRKYGYAKNDRKEVFAEKKPYYLLTLIPAAFMIAVCLTYLLTSGIGFGLSEKLIPWVGTFTFVLSIASYYLIRGKRK